jgi:hypothetical protein
VLNKQVDKKKIFFISHCKKLPTVNFKRSKNFLDEKLSRKFIHKNVSRDLRENVDSENSKSDIFAENTAENFKIKIFKKFMLTKIMGKMLV